MSSTDSATGIADKHHIEFDTLGNFKPDELMHMVCDTIIKRLMDVADFIDGKQETTYMDNYNLTFGDINSLIIRGESHTMGGLITNYTYMIDPSIQFITYNEIHPTERSIKIRWKHPSGVNIIHKALMNAKTTFEQLKKEIKERN